MNFTASAEHNAVKLKWSTATETNNSGFGIERISAYSPGYSSGIWEKIGFVEGKGTTSEITHYNFIDQKPYSSGKVLYRLSQIDLDGKITYSSSVEINTDFITKDYRLEQNYPNPFNPATIIKYNLPEESKIKIDIINLLGEIVAEIINEVQPGGYYNATWNAENFSSGVYYAVMRAESQITGKSHFQVIKMVYLK
jgi:hypothetical protein